MIDSHVHLEFNDYDADRSDVIERARRAGVHTMITIGSAQGASSLLLARDLAHTIRGIFFTAGAHPHCAKLFNPSDWSLIEEASQDDKCVAIGETGLDYHFDLAEKNAQKKLFEKHVELTLRIQKPLIIHCREAFDDVLPLVQRQGLTGVFHCFTGSVAEAEAILALGFYISISGIVTFKKSEQVEEVVRMIPLNRLLIETDAPFLAPVPERGRRNEPAFLGHTLRRVAEIRGQEPCAVEKATEENTKALFSI